MRSLAVAMVLVATTASADVAPDQQALEVVNRYRAAAGLGAVQLDPKLSKGCMEHAEYMRLHHGSDAMAGLNAHTQRPQLPGATKAGAACAKAADLFPGVANLGAAVDAWMAGIYHRRPILDPKLARLGVGYAVLPNGALTAALMFDNNRAANASWPVAYPADRQTGVPLEYGAEIPNPIPGGGHGGYAITLQFPPFDKLQKVSATLVANGKPVPFYFSDPEHPATSFPQSGIVSLIPKQPLAPQTTYAVKIDATWQGKRKTWAWSFTTIALRSIDASDIAALTSAIGIPSRVRGTVTHGGMIDSNTVFLALAEAGGKMVSVVMPVATWKQLAKAAKPQSFKGRALAVDATPQLVGTKFINLPIGSPKQLKLAR